MMLRLVIGGLVFALVVTVAQLSRILRAERRSLFRDRILGEEPEQPMQLAAAADEPTARSGFLARMEMEARRAGVKVETRMLLYIMVAVGVFSFVVLDLVLGNPILALPGLLVSRIGPSFYLRMLIRRRAAAFESQFESALIQMANAMRAGEALLNAVRGVGETMPDPIGYEFRRVYQDMRLGTPQMEAFRRLGERVQSSDYQMFLATVDLQSQAGGNMVESFEKIAATIRDRQAAREAVRAKTAQGRFSGYIIAAMPVVILAIMAVIMPQYLAYFTASTSGRMLLTACGFLIVAGIVWVQRIVNIKFE